MYILVEYLKFLPQKINTRRAHGYFVQMEIMNFWNEMYLCNEIPLTFRSLMCLHTLTKLKLGNHQGDSEEIMGTTFTSPPSISFFEFAYSIDLLYLVVSLSFSLALTLSFSHSFFFHFIILWTFCRKNESIFNFFSAAVSGEPQ